MGVVGGWTKMPAIDFQGHADAVHIDEMSVRERQSQLRSMLRRLSRGTQQPDLRMVGPACRPGDIRLSSTPEALGPFADNVPGRRPHSRPVPVPGRGRCGRETVPPGCGTSPLPFLAHNGSARYRRRRPECVWSAPPPVPSGLPGCCRPGRWSRDVPPANSGDSPNGRNAVPVPGSR